MAPTSEEKLSRLENVVEGKPASAPREPESAAELADKATKAAKRAKAKAAAEKNGTAANGKAGKNGKPAKGEKMPEVEKPKKYRAANLLDFPVGKEDFYPLKSLTFDEAMQMRVALYDEYTVEKYADRYRDGVKMPPVRAIRSTEDGKTLWVYDGFERGEGAKRAGVKELPVIVSDGTYEDAMFYALRANAAHGLARTSEDCRKAVYTAIDNPNLFGRIAASAEKYGGLNRALAAATGTSKGLVSRALNARGLTIAKGKIVKETGDNTRRKPKKDKNAAALGGLFAVPSSKPPAEGMPATFEEFQKLSPAEQKRLNKAASESLSQAVIADQLSEAMKVTKRLGALVTSLLTNKEHGAEFKKSLAQAGYPVEKEWDYKPIGDKENAEAYFALLEHWPVVRELSKIFQDFNERVNPKPAPEPAEEPAAAEAGK
jgi:hypothetical protein